MSFGSQRRVTNPRNRVWRVGWRVFSSKTRLNQPDQRLQKSGNSSFFPASFWSNYFKSNEIYAGFMEISTRFGGNLTKSSEISPDSMRSLLDLANFHLKKTILVDFSTMDDPTAFRCQFDSFVGQRRV